jgi:hypothetical protein
MTSVSFPEGSIDHWAPQMKTRHGSLFAYADRGLVQVHLSTGKGAEHGLDHVVRMSITRDEARQVARILLAAARKVDV